MDILIFGIAMLALIAGLAVKLYLVSRELDNLSRRFRQHREAVRELMKGNDRDIEGIREEHIKVMEKLLQVEELIPADIKEEMGRRDILLREMNDEMERGLKMERTWNDGLQSILNYSAATGTEATNNE